MIKNVEEFFQDIVCNKIYWTKEILLFFGIKEEDIPIFLSYHEIYKLFLN
jgi:hypothetical protein